MDVLTEIEASYEFAVALAWGDRREPLSAADGRKAIAYLKFAFENGITDGAVEIGNMYAAGRGVDRDREQARQWYGRALEAERSRADIYGLLGDACLYIEEPEGVRRSDDPEDVRRAGAYYEKGASAGDVRCLWQLGDRYFRGDDREQDYNKAFSFYSQSHQRLWEACSFDEEQVEADGSWPDLCLRLGRCYLHGFGVDADPAAAMQFLDDGDRACGIRLRDGDLSLAETRQELDREIEYLENNSCK